MSEDPIKKILKDVGLTEKETDVYIFLAKHGALKGIEIAKQTRIDKAEVYRILKSLQSKGLLESTLEAPVRFITVPFDKVIDSFVKARRDEAAIIERKKEDLLDDWKKISKTSLELAAEKFVVIEGESKIYPKIFQMINETKQQLSAISMVRDLFRGYQSGLFDAAFQHPLKSQIQFRFLTELSQENVSVVKNLLKKMPNVGLNFRGRTSDLGLRLSPRMVIRDDEEILFFITPRTDAMSPMKIETCLWTNCRELVQSFVAVFEDLWRNSADIEGKIEEIETGKPSPNIFSLNTSAAKKKYDETLFKAKEEIVIMTSSEGLIESKSVFQLRDLAQRGISIKIMAPINGENLETALQLLAFCEVRHIPKGYFLTTLVDKAHVFQSDSTSSDHQTLGSKYSENMFYTNDSDYVGKTKNMLADIWRNARPPSAITLESILNPATIHSTTISNPLSKVHNTLKKVNSIALVEEKTPNVLTEKDVLKKIIDAKNDPTKTHIQYGIAGQAIIHPQGILNMPDLLFYVLHYDKNPVYATQNILIVNVWSKTPKGFAFVPAVFICDNSESLDFWKKFLAGLPFAQNMQLVDRDELQVKLYGNNLFCGWTAPILLSPSLKLQPACIMLEACGDLKTSAHTLDFPSGCRIVHEYNGFEAFVTFWNQSSKYSGPGTEGFIARENVSTISPLSNR